MQTVHTTSLFVLILYTSTFLKEFISYRSSLVEFWGSLIYTIISSANSGTLTSFFPLRIPSISLSCLIALAKTSSTILNINGTDEWPCLLVPGFSRIAFLSFLSF